MNQLQVGDTVWIDGQPTLIIGETRVSWKVKPGNQWAKVLTFPKRPEDPKWIMTSEDRKGFGGYRVWLSERAFLENRWVYEYRYQIGRRVEAQDFAVLNEIAKLVGFTPLLGDAK